MTKIELVQRIGNDICENCDDMTNDCGIALDECDRIDNAIAILDEYIEENHE